jgi:hypothetical protein
MAGNIEMGFAVPRDLVYGFCSRFGMTTILFLFVFNVGCLETDDCIQHVHMDSNGDIYYTFEGESCGEVVYPPNQSSVMVQFEESFLANVGTTQEK